MTYRFIKYSMDGAVGTLTLNRPERLNSLNKEMLAELRDAMKGAAQAARDARLRCLVLTGSGRGFCTGQDLRERVRDGKFVTPDLSRSLEENYNPLVRAIAELPLPVIAAVNGVAAGAGASLALACDIVLAARSASFIQSFSRVGLIPDAGGTWQLPHRVGMARAKGLALLGEAVDADQAESWGLIWRCLEDGDLMREAMSLARRLAGQATASLALTKRALGAAVDNTLDQQLDLERDLQAIAGRSEDYREGVMAFLEKREAEFKGR